MADGQRSADPVEPRPLQLGHAHVLVLEEIRQHVGVRPAGVSGLGPAVKVAHVAPRVNVVVDYRAAAQPLAGRPRARLVYQSPAGARLLVRVVPIDIYIYE